MPNWIEAAVAFLKNKLSLRLAMFWLLSWMVLLLVIPTGVADFINSGIGKWDIPYIGLAVFLIPISFFVSMAARSALYYLTDLSEKVTEKRNVSSVKSSLYNLSEDEVYIVRYIFERGSSDGMKSVKASAIFSLAGKGIIKSYDFESPLNSVYYLSDEHQNALMSIIAEQPGQ